MRNMEDRLKYRKTCNPLRPRDDRFFDHDQCCESEDFKLECVECSEVRRSARSQPRISNNPRTSENDATRVKTYQAGSTRVFSNIFRRQLGTLRRRFHL